MSEIFLIRHAQASFDAADYDCLSSRGEAQAGKLGAWMAARGGKPGAIFTGTLRRHAQTATLAELAASGDARRAFQALFSAAVARWTSGQADGDYTLAWPAFRAAVLEAWSTLAKESAEEIWVVSSGGPIAVIATLLAGTDPQRTFDFAWPLVNTSVSRIRTGRRGAQLVTYKAWPHLDTADAAALVTHR